MWKGFLLLVVIWAVLALLATSEHAEDRRCPRARQLSSIACADPFATECGRSRQLLSAMGCRIP